MATVGLVPAVSKNERLVMKINEKDGTICSYCGAQVSVYRAAHFLHACTNPACQRAFEQDTQFDKPPLPEEVVKRWKKDTPNHPTDPIHGRD